MTERYPRGTAYHEAGHAVVAWSLGLPVKAISISDDDASGDILIGLATHLSLVDQIAVCAAGIEAAEVFEQPTHELAGALDHGMIIDLFEDHGISEEKRDDLRTEGHARARNHLEAHRSKVIALAEQLVEHGRIEAGELLLLMQSTL